MAERRSVVDFGFDPAASPYHFAVVVQPRDKGVVIEERFSYALTGTAPDVDASPKASLDSYRWGRIAEAARQDFNRRLVRNEGRPARWRADVTLLAPHVGKELVLLFWATEDADPTAIPNIVANWSGLAPEERWWFYTTINATAGHPDHGRDRGWRKALKIALAENPSDIVTPGGWLTEGDVAHPGSPSRRRGRERIRTRSVRTDQLELLPTPQPDQLTLSGTPSGEHEE